MQRKFVNTKQQFSTQTSGFGQPLVNQPRFNGQPLQSSNHRIAALLPDPITPPIRNQNNFANRNNKKTYNASSSNISQPTSFSLPRHKINLANNNDHRINHKVDMDKYIAL